MDLLKIENVSKEYSGHKALDDVSLDVPANKIYGLLGPNGAGKTTLIRIINHITAPDKGSVIFDGHPLCQNDVYQMGYLPEERGLYKKMKVGEQAVFFARLKGMTRRDAVTELKKWFDKFGISEWWNKKVEELSKGMAQKIQFIITVLHRPKLLIFDEPFSGFDPINVRLLTDEILNLKDEGATIIFSTHNMASVESLCENITLINKSHNILTGNVAEIRRRFGANRYVFTFEGDRDALIDAFGRRIDEIVGDYRGSVTDDSTTNMVLSGDGQERKLIARFHSDVPLREIISIANESVELRGFSSDLPSMDEIFIRSVENNNKRI